MASDYIAAVCIRYGLLLVAGGVMRMWVMPDAWGDAVAAAILVYALVVVHTEPAARFARRLPRPWPGWMMLSAACAHAFGAAAVLALSPFTQPRFADPRGGGMQFEVLWERTAPSLLDMGLWIAACALFSAAWAVLIGWASRVVWGVLPPEPRLLHLRKRADVEGEIEAGVRHAQRESSTESG